MHSVNISVFLSHTHTQSHSYPCTYSAYRATQIKHDNTTYAQPHSVYASKQSSNNNIPCRRFRSRCCERVSDRERQREHTYTNSPAASPPMLLLLLLCPRSTFKSAINATTLLLSIRNTSLFRRYISYDFERFAGRYIALEFGISFKRVAS